MRQIALTVTLALAVWALPLHAAPDLSGVWILYKAEDFANPAFTAAGKAFQKSYDFTNDDPALKCIPASWTRVYSNPNTPIEIIQNTDSIHIRYELFDIDRKVRLVNGSGDWHHAPNSERYPTLGDSVAWYDGDDLLIHTLNYGSSNRVLSTIRTWAGVPQSPLMVTLERYHRDGRVLNLEITHFDPVMYTEPLVVKYPLDREDDYHVEPYNCEPENAEVVSPDELHKK